MSNHADSKLVLVAAIPAIAFLLALPGMAHDLKLWQWLLIISFWMPLISISVAALRFLAMVGPVEPLRRQGRDQRHARPK